MFIQTIIELDQILLSLTNGSGSAFLDRWMMVLTSGLTWIPLYVALLYLVVKNHDTMPQILLVAGCAVLCVVIADGMADFIVKPLVARQRPCNDVLMKYSVHVVDGMRSKGFSFFSAHAANTFSLALFFSLCVRSRLLSLSLTGWSLLNAYTRLYLGQHYFSDVLAGLLWGAIAALLSYALCRRAYKKLSTGRTYLSTQYTSTGYARSDAGMVCAVLLSTLIGSIGVANWVV